MLAAKVCSSPANLDPCSEYSLSRDLISESSIFSAAVRKPCCPSLQVSMRLLSVERILELEVMLAYRCSNDIRVFSMAIVRLPNFPSPHSNSHTLRCGHSVCNEKTRGY